MLYIVSKAYAEHTSLPCHKWFSPYFFVTIFSILKTKISLSRKKSKLFDLILIVLLTKCQALGSYVCN